MKIKELTTIGFKPTPKKDYYYYIQDHFYLLLQVLPHHKIALLLTTEDSKHQRDILEQLFIKRDDVERIYSNEKGAGLVLSKRIKKEELENIVLTLKKEINQLPQCHHCHQSKSLNVYLLDDEIDILCSDCFEKHERITKHTASPLGILGAFIGAVIGGIIWAFGYNLGYIICLDAILLSLLSFIGYKKLGHYIDQKAKIIIPLIDILVLLFAQYASCAFSVQAAFKRIGTSSVSFIQALVVVPGMMFDSSLIGLLLVYLFYGLILIIITLIILFIYDKRKNSYYFTYKCINGENS